MNYNNSIVSVPFPQNEPQYTYAPNTKERALLKSGLKELKSQVIDIPLIIGGKEIRTGNTEKIVCPHNHHHVLATYHKAGKEEVFLAIEESQKA